MDEMTELQAAEMEAAIRGRFGLSDLAARFLWLVFTDTENTARYLLWQNAGGAAEDASASSACHKVWKDKRTQAALEWLKLPRTQQAARDRGDHLERLRQHATTSMGTYADVEEIRPDRATLRIILDDEDLEDEEAFSAFRRHLFAVRAKSWSGLPPEALQSVVAVKETKDGRVEIKLEPRVAAEQALARSHGWQSIQVQIKGEAQAMAIEAFKKIETYVRARSEDAANLMIAAFEHHAKKESEK